MSLLTQRRDTAPYGLEGGGEGVKGRNGRVFLSGQRKALPGSISYAANAGEGLIIETPGGGGFGALG